MGGKIIFEFESGGKKTVIGYPDYSILDYDGLESTDYELVTEENINHHGSRKKRTRILPREIMVKFAYLGQNKESERQRLISFFSPLRDGTLKILYQEEERCIEYEVSSFKYDSRALFEPLMGTLYVECMDPDLLSVLTLGQQIMTLVGGWKWKFTLPFKMKQYGQLRKNIYVAGDMETPVEIYFRGPAVNPVVTNHRTGEYIKVTKTLTSDDTLYINTAFRQKTVEIITGDVRQDAWDFLDFSSRFFWLQPGDNMLEYSGDSEPEKSRGVEIYYRERYLGI